MFSKTLAATVIALLLSGICLNQAFAFKLPFQPKPKEAAWILHPDSDPLSMNYYIRIEKVTDKMFVTFSEMLQPGPNLILVSDSDPGNVRTLTINYHMVANCESGLMLLPEVSEQHFKNGKVLNILSRNEKKYWVKDRQTVADICMRAGVKTRFEIPLGNVR